MSKVLVQHEHSVAPSGRLRPPAGGATAARGKKKSPPASLQGRGGAARRRLPTLPLLRSTIGVAGLNFSVRDGKRWNPGAVAT